MRLEYFFSNFSPLHIFLNFQWPYLIIWACLALVPAFIAHSKGRNFIAWLIYGILMLPVAYASAMIISTDYKALEKRIRLAKENKIPSPAK